MGLSIQQQAWKWDAIFSVAFLGTWLNVMSLRVDALKSRQLEKNSKEKKQQQRVTTDSGDRY